MLCKKYNIKWYMNTNGITIYRSKYDTKGIWFPLENCEEAVPLILKIAGITTTSQSSLNNWL